MNTKYEIKTRYVRFELVETNCKKLKKEKLKTKSL